MMRKSWISVLLFLLISTCCNAQTAGYKFYAALDSIKTSGIYNIEITPALSAHLKTDYSDLRVVNDSGRWVPHVMHFTEDGQRKNIVAVPVKVEQKTTLGSITTLVLKSNSNFLSEFDILINATAASRAAKLSGSDNAIDWFVIEDSFNLEPITLHEKNETKYNIKFPSCKYKFFKILIDNKNNDPVNIQSVTYNADLTVYLYNISVKSDNPSSLLYQKDSAKESYIKITQKETYHFDHFNLKISGPKYFYRKVDMYLPNGDSSSFSNPGELYQSFYISNNSASEFPVSLINPKTFCLLIHNEDNLPLKIDEVKTWSRQRFLTTYLEKGNSYKLIMDNKAAEMPDYDLSKLDIKLSDSIPFLSFQTIIPFAETSVVTVAPKNYNWILWSSIAVVLFILLLFTKKMVKEVDKRKEHDSI